MPLYDYHCKGCGGVFEMRVSGSETAFPTEAERSPICPRCQSQDTQQISSAADSSKKAGDYSSSFASRRRFT